MYMHICVLRMCIWAHLHVYIHSLRAIHVHIHIYIYIFLYIYIHIDSCIYLRAIDARPYLYINMLYKFIYQAQATTRTPSLPRYTTKQP